MHYATSTHTSLVANARKSWSPVVALAWPGHRHGIPSTGGRKGQYRLNKEQGGSLMERDGRPQGPTYTCPPDRISASPPPSPLRYSDPRCSVYRRGGVHPCLFKRYWPLWLPVRASTTSLLLICN